MALTPWSPALLGALRRRGLGGERAAQEAAALCRRRLEAKLAQLYARTAMPPHVRASLEVHIRGMLATPGGGYEAVAAAARTVTDGANAATVVTSAASQPAETAILPPLSAGLAGHPHSEGVESGQLPTDHATATKRSRRKKTATMTMGKLFPSTPPLEVRPCRRYLA